MKNQFTQASKRFVTLAAAALCVFALLPAAHSQTQTQTQTQSQPPAKKPTSTSTTAKKPAAKKPATAPAATAATKSTEAQLSALALALRDKPTALAEQHMIDFAQLHPKDDFGSWAALALGHYYLDRNHPPEALKWFAAALHHPSRLDQYAMFWHAQTLRQLGHNDEALAELADLRHKFPDSVMSDLAVQSYAEGAIAQGDAKAAAAMLDAYANTSQKPVLLLLRAQAREKSGSAIAAAKDYVTIYYDFPLSDEARAAGQRLPPLGRELGDAFPGVPVAQQTARAEALFGAHRWSDARQEFEATLPETGGADHDHAELRIAQTHSSQGGGASSLVSVKFADPGAEAERLYSLSQAYRNEKREPEMLAAINDVATRFPQGQWTAEALFATGNYYWVLLNRPLAADYYRRSADAFPAGKNTQVAVWRATWAAYMDRKPETVSLLESFIRTYPTSTSVPDALYWLGRAAEHDGNVARARSFYVKGEQRFPQTFFGLRAADRVAELGTQPLEPAEILSVIPDAPPLAALDAPIPDSAQERWQRVIALRTIGFDSSAELELRAAYAATQSPRLLLEAAQSAIAAEHYSVGITLARQAYPATEARKISDMPPAVAKALYPLPYFSSVSTAASHDHVDPMIVAGVMRQESAFQSEAVSIAGAVGLMQVLPKTAPALAKRLKLRYSRIKLFDPEYNLQLGTLYLADLIGQFGGPEGALAAYNAGEDRSKLWRGERNYSEPAEFVESIPFTQTHDYVQIVMRNAQIYHMLNPGPVAAPAATKPAAAKTSASKSTSAKSKTRGAS
jgi:soluble lytic murein transglycosylase